MTIVPIDTRLDERVRAHVERLLAGGVRVGQIARAAGVSSQTVRNLLRPGWQLRPSTRARLLAVKPPLTRGAPPVRRPIVRSQVPVDVCARVLAVVARRYGLLGDDDCWVWGHALVRAVTGPLPFVVAAADGRAIGAFMSARDAVQWTRLAGERRLPERIGPEEMRVR